MRFLLLNQCFYPDVVSTAQHLTDLARGLAEQGHEITVVTSDRGYDNPRERYERRESWNGVQIIRIPSLSFGKETKLKRALNFGSFLIVCSLRLLTLRKFDVVVALTSPPLISFLGALFVAIKGGRFCFWVMDLNPDEAIAAGWLREDSFVARVLGSLLNYSLRRADRVVVLDRFMKDRVLRKGIPSERISVLPPWSHDDAVTYSAEGRRLFRERHGLEGKFVVMYSGNHSPCHPLDTLLDAALEIKSRTEIVFCFVGGGTEQKKVRAFTIEHRLQNIICLPYQPLEELSGSLSAADLHVVVMGDRFAGIVHPCKIYNILRLGTSTLYVGAPESHITDLAEYIDSDRLFLAQHGETALVAKHITHAAGLKANNFPPASHANAGRFSKQSLLPQMIELLGFRDSTTDVGSTEFAPTQQAIHSDSDSNAQEVVSL